MRHRLFVFAVFVLYFAGLRVFVAISDAQAAVLLFDGEPGEPNSEKMTPTNRSIHRTDHDLDHDLKII